MNANPFPAGSALYLAIEHIEADAKAALTLRREKRKAKLYGRIGDYAVSDVGLLDWLGDCSRRPIPFTFDSLDEAISKLTGCVRVEREYCRTHNWKRRPEIAAGQWDRLLVARYLRRMAAKQSVHEAA